MSRKRTIGALSQDSGVHLETIRYYERIGLLPEPPRSASGYRYYDDTAAQRLRFIRRGRNSASASRKSRLCSNWPTTGINLAGKRISWRRRTWSRWRPRLPI